jgi:hypothetical protein
MVPFVLSEAPGPLTLGRLAGDLRNFDIFELSCNGAA